MATTLKILTVFTHYPVCSGRYVTDAFKRLGHDVRHIGNSTGNQIPWGGDGWIGLDAKYAYASDGDLTAHWSDWTPDLVVILDSAWKYHHPVYADVPHVVYGVDNHVRDYLQPGIVRYFLAHKAVSVMSFNRLDYPFTGDAKDAEDFIEWLPCAYDPTVFTPSPIAWVDREYDACLIGVAYPQRVQLVEALAKAGLKVLAGVGWVYNQYAEAYQNSRISLCVSANGDVAQRVFETAAMGCAILTDNCPDLAEIKGFSGAIFEDVDSAVEQAKAILETGKAPNNKWALPHTWDARAARIVQWYQEAYGNQETAEVTEAETAIEFISEPFDASMLSGRGIRISEAGEHILSGGPDNLRVDGKPAEIVDLDAEIHVPAEIDELPVPAKAKRKKRGH